VQKGAWDIDSWRSTRCANAGIDFTAPYVVIEGAYVVPVGLPAQDRRGRRRDAWRVAVARARPTILSHSRAQAWQKLVRESSGRKRRALFARIGRSRGRGEEPIWHRERAPGYERDTGRFMVIEQDMARPRVARQACGICASIEEMEARLRRQARRASGQTMQRRTAVVGEMTSIR